MKARMNCDTCRWWDSSVDSISGNLGFCRFYPPQIHQMTDKNKMPLLVANWPLSGGSDWCAKHKERDEPAMPAGSCDCGEIVEAMARAIYEDEMPNADWSLLEGWPEMRNERDRCLRLARAALDVALDRMEKPAWQAIMTRAICGSYDIKCTDCPSNYPEGCGCARKAALATVLQLRKESLG